MLSSCDVKGCWMLRAVRSALCGFLQSHLRLLKAGMSSGEKITNLQVHLVGCVLQAE